MNPAFTAAYQGGTNFANSFREARETSALDNILKEAMTANDPNKLRQTMGAMLSKIPPSKQPFALKVLEGKLEELETGKKRENVNQAYDAAGIPRGDQYLPPGVQSQREKGREGERQFQNIVGQPNKPNQSQPMQEGAQNSSIYSKLTDDQLVQLTGVPQHSNQSKEEIRRRQQERKVKAPGTEFSNIREKSVADYTNNSITKGEEAEDLKYTIETAKKAIQGEVAGPGLEAMAKNNPYMQLLTGLTPDEAALQAANKKLVGGAKGIFGSKPTEREIFLLLNSMLPSIGKSKEANMAGLDYIERVNDMAIMHSDIVNELTDGGTKYVPDIERQVNAKMRPYSERLREDLKSSVESLSPKDKESTDRILVRSPDGTEGRMTQKQIDDAKAKNVIFTPVKK